MLINSYLFIAMISSSIVLSLVLGIHLKYEEIKRFNNSNYKLTKLQKGDL